MKKCPNCNTVKSLESFHNNKTRYDGKQGYCKECWAIKDKNNPKRKESGRRWYENNKEIAIKRAARRQLEKPDELREYKKEHYRKNKATYKAKAKEWTAKDRKINKHRYIWRGLLRRSLLPKVASTADTLGYSAEQLRIHLEKLWLDGMTWENYGEWHVDHIAPVASFDANTPACVVNALQNLRPLWATTRIVDGIQITGNLNRSKPRARR